MQIHNIKVRAGQLESLCKSACLDDRLGMRPEVLRTIRTLKAHSQPIPRSLRRLEDALDQDAFEQMFDNVPI